MTDVESSIFWATALMLAASFFTGLLALTFSRVRPLALARVFMALATVTLTAFGVVRWLNTGHPPFVSMFESMLASIWFLLVIYQAMRWKVPAAGLAMIPVAGLAMMFMGWSSALPQEASPLSAALENVWLFIHASFATAAAGTFLIGASYSIIYLLGRPRLEKMAAILPGLPDHDDLPHSVVTFLLFGLVLWGVMIVSGSVWAHVAWGRYWAWDPVELWSLISWMLYGLLYHSRMSLRLPPRAFCILNIIAVCTVAFSLWGIQYVYRTIHTYG